MSAKQLRSVRLAVQLTPAEAKRLRKLADQRDTNMSELVRSRLPSQVTTGIVASKVRA